VPRGASAYLAAVKPVIIVESWAKALKLRQFLSEFGYSLYRYDHRTGRLVEHSVEQSGQADLLALADGQVSQLSSRLAAAARPALTRPRIVGWV
jgi:hypothetical protein